MNSAQLLAEAEPKSHKPAGMAPRPESSRALLGLLGLIRRANAGHERQAVAGRPDPLAGVIARPVLRALLAGLQYRLPRHCAARAADGAAGRGNCHRTRLGTPAVDLLRTGGPAARPGQDWRARQHPQQAGGDSPATKPSCWRSYHHVGLDVLTGCGVHDQVREMIAGAFPHYDDTETARLSPTMSLGARILAIADAYDAMRTDQPYRAALSHAEIMSALTKQGNPRFDASIVNTLNRLAASGGALSGLKSPHPADNELSPLTDSETVEAAGFVPNLLVSLHSGKSVRRLYRAGCRLAVPARQPRCRVCLRPCCGRVKGPGLDQPHRAADRCRGRSVTGIRNAAGPCDCRADQYFCGCPRAVAERAIGASRSPGGAADR